MTYNEQEVLLLLKKFFDELRDHPTRFISNKDLKIWWDQNKKQ